jgi:hypothetical protein
MMLFNKNQFLKNFSNNRKKSIHTYENIKQNMYFFNYVANNIWLHLRKEKKFKSTSMKII